jgi:hypothetical protein
MFEKKCAICLHSGLQTSLVQRAPQCGHFYHKRCLKFGRSLLGCDLCYEYKPLYDTYKIGLDRAIFDYNNAVDWWIMSIGFYMSDPYPTISFFVGPLDETQTINFNLIQQRFHSAYFKRRRIAAALYFVWFMLAELIKRCAIINDEFVIFAMCYVRASNETYDSADSLLSVNIPYCARIDYGRLTTYFQNFIINDCYTMCNINAEKLMDRITSYNGTTEIPDEDDYNCIAYINIFDHETKKIIEYLSFKK